MAQVIDLTDFKCLNQLVNGSAFTSSTSDNTDSLVGNVGEKVKLEYTFRAYWEAHSSPSDEWDINNTSGSTYTIATQATDFRAEGFEVGDNILLDDDYGAQTLATSSGGSNANGTITDISPNGQLLTFTATGGTVKTGASNDNQQIIAWLGDSSFIGNNEWDLFEIRFGLVGNNESFNSQSKVSGNDMAYQASGITYGGTTTMNPKGTFKDWQTGSMDITEATVGGVGEFTIEHELIIAPTLPIGNDIETDQAPDYLSGSDSLKYSFEVTTRENRLSSRNLVLLINDRTGYVGWYEENFNGFGNDYSASATLTDTASGDSVNALQALESTTFEITLETTGTAFASGDPVVIYLQKQPTETSQIQDTTTDFTTNFQYHNLVLTEGAAATTSGIWTNVEANIVSGDMVITGEVELSASEKASISEGDKYLFAVTHHPAATNAVNSPRTMAIASYKEYILANTVEGLATFNTFNYLKHYEAQGVDAGSTTERVWNEDGILLDFELALDKNRNAFLQSIDFILAADDGTNYWAIDKYTMELADAPVNSSGNQLVNIDTTRGYKLPDGDQFNQVRMFYDSTSGTDDIYKGWIGIKVRWEDWIADPNVDADFFDDTKPNDNLNKRSNNYDGLNGYEIKVIAVVNTTGEDSVGNAVIGLDTERGGRLETYDYDESDDGLITGYTLSLLDPDTGVDLGNVLRRDKDTLFRIEWDLTSAPALDNLWAINRIQRTGGTGQQIEEFSSILTNIEDILKPVSGATYLEVTNPSGNTVRCDCLIDHTKLASGVSYNLSGTLQTPLIERFVKTTFNFREGIDTLVWEIPDVFLGGDEITNLAEAETFGDITLGSLSYELDTGSGYTSYASFSAFATALEAADPTLTRNVRISTSATGFVNGGIILKYQKFVAISPAVDVDLEFEATDIDYDGAIWFDELITVSNISFTGISSSNATVYWAVHTVNPDGTDSWTQFTALGSSPYTALQAAIDAVGASTKYAIHFALVLDGNLVNAAGISNPSINLQGSFQDSSIHDLVDFHVGTNTTNTPNRETISTSKSLELDNPTSNNPSHYHWVDNRAFSAGANGQRDVDEDQAVMLSFEITKAQGTLHQIFSTKYAKPDSTNDNNENAVSLRHAESLGGIFQFGFLEVSGPNNLFYTYRTVNKSPYNKKITFVLSYDASESPADRLRVWIDGVESSLTFFSNGTPITAINPNNYFFCGLQSFIAPRRTASVKYQRIVRIARTVTELEARQWHDELEIPSTISGDAATGGDIDNDFVFDQTSGDVQDVVGGKDLTRRTAGAAPTPSYVDYYV